MGKRRLSILMLVVAVVLILPAIIVPLALRDTDREHVYPETQIRSGTFSFARASSVGINLGVVNPEVAAPILEVLFRQIVELDVIGYVVPVIFEYINIRELLEEIEDFELPPQIEDFLDELLSEEGLPVFLTFLTEFLRVIINTEPDPEQTCTLERLVHLLESVNPKYDPEEMGSLFAEIIEDAWTLIPEWVIDEVIAPVVHHGLSGLVDMVLTTTEPFMNDLDELFDILSNITFVVTGHTIRIDLGDLADEIPEGLDEAVFGLTTFSYRLEGTGSAQNIVIYQPSSHFDDPDIYISDVIRQVLNIVGDFVDLPFPNGLIDLLFSGLITGQIIYNRSMDNITVSLGINTPMLDIPNLIQLSFTDLRRQPSSTIA